MGLAHLPLGVVMLLVPTGFLLWYLRDIALPWWRIVLLQFLLVLSAFIGVKLFALWLRDWQLITPWTLELYGSGRYPGAVLSVLLLMPWVLRALVVRGCRLLVADALALSFCLGMALARVSCFINSCCVGGHCETFFCIEYPRGTSLYFQQLREGLITPVAQHTAPVFPLHLFLGGLGLFVFFSLLRFAPQRRYPGQLVLLFIVLHDGGKAVLETWRVPYVAELQWASAIYTALAAFVLIVFAMRGYKEPLDNYIAC